jgi:hypothetical protein
MDRRARDFNLQARMKLVALDMLMALLVHVGKAGVHFEHGTRRTVVRFIRGTGGHLPFIEQDHGCCTNKVCAGASDHAAHYHVLMIDVLSNTATVGTPQSLRRQRT